MIDAYNVLTESILAADEALAWFKAARDSVISF
jgi:hypothetical protein